MGNLPEVLRFIGEGADWTRIEHVRPDIISSEITKVTAPEQPSGPDGCSWCASWA
jgi:hypothetical protein